MTLGWKTARRSISSATVDRPKDLQSSSTCPGRTTARQKLDSKQVVKVHWSSGSTNTYICPGTPPLHKYELLIWKHNPIFPSQKKRGKKRQMRDLNMESREKKTFSFSLIERVILSAGAMLIFSVSFQIDQMPEGKNLFALYIYI
jgi:hypothetical protein